jgi:hypothetical protein
MKLHPSHLNARLGALMHRPMRISPASVKRTSGYGCGGKDSASAGFGQSAPAVRHGFTKRKWSPPAKSGARSGAHSWPGAKQCVQSFKPSTALFLQHALP